MVSHFGTPRERKETPTPRDQDTICERSKHVESFIQSLPQTEQKQRESAMRARQEGVKTVSIDGKFFKTGGSNLNHHRQSFERTIMGRDK